MVFLNPDFKKEVKLPDRVDWNLRVDVANNLCCVHVRGVLEVSWQAMVFANEGIENISKVDIGILITSIDTTMLNTIS